MPTTVPPFRLHLMLLLICAGVVAIPALTIRAAQRADSSSERQIWLNTQRLESLEHEFNAHAQAQAADRTVERLSLLEQRVASLDSKATESNWLLRGIATILLSLLVQTYWRKIFPPREREED